MRKIIIATLCLLFVWGGAALAAGNEFNPYLQNQLPVQQLHKGDLDIIASMGGKAMNIQDEAAHRPHWREEAYPVVFGNRKAPQEILVLLDYAAPQSAVVWQDVVRAVPSLDPYATKIAVFGRSSEKYGTELMGTGIWLTFTRPPYAMDFFTYSLTTWNAIKNAQKQRGINKPFTYEYDATLSSSDYPLAHTYLQKIRPPLPESAEVELLRYGYDAGNVNLFQAVSIMAYYGIQQLPAVVVNGKVLSNPTAAAIVQAGR